MKKLLFGLLGLLIALAVRGDGVSGGSSAAKSEFNFGVYFGNNGSPVSGTALGQVLVSYASTVTAASSFTSDSSGAADASNLVFKLCSDGVICGAGNVYLTCTAPCTQTEGTSTACTVTKAAIAANTTVTWGFATQCAIIGFVTGNLNAHFTNP